MATSKKIEDLVKKDDAVEKKLRGTMTAGSLADLVNKRKQERVTYLLLDISSSMAWMVNQSSWNNGSGPRRIDALRAILDGLEGSGVHIPKIAFSDDAHVITDLPEPSGGTNLRGGIDFAKLTGAEHLIVISDGEPDDAPGALKAGIAFDGPIDVFYVGPPNGPGEKFLADLCNTTGGEYAPADLGKPKELQSKIAGLLGSGTPQIEPRKGAIQL